MGDGIPEQLLFCSLEDVCLAVEVNIHSFDEADPDDPKDISNFVRNCHLG